MSKNKSRENYRHKKRRRSDVPVGTDSLEQSVNGCFDIFQNKVQKWHTDWIKRVKGGQYSPSILREFVDWYSEVDTRVLREAICAIAKRINEITGDTGSEGVEVLDLFSGFGVGPSTLLKVGVVDTAVLVDSSDSNSRHFPMTVPVMWEQTGLAERGRYIAGDVGIQRRNKVRLPSSGIVTVLGTGLMVPAAERTSYDDKAAPLQMLLKGMPPRQIMGKLDNKSFGGGYDTKDSLSAVVAHLGGIRRRVFVADLITGDDPVQRAMEYLRCELCKDGLLASLAGRLLLPENNIVRVEQVGNNGTVLAELTVGKE